MKLATCKLLILLSPVLATVDSATLADSGYYDLSWYTIDCGGSSSSTGGDFQLSGTIGQPDAGMMEGGSFELVGGFWGPASSSGAGVPAATVIGAVSRKSCDLNVLTGVASEPRQDGITELRLTFDTPPGGPGAKPVTIEEATCAAPVYSLYSGSSVLSASVAGNDLVLVFTPGLENGRTYRIIVESDVTSILNQILQVRGLVGDVNGDGRTNGSDRSTVVAAWTSPANLSCQTDLDGNGRTHGPDRSIVVASWTSGQNCAP